MHFHTFVALDLEIRLPWFQNIEIQGGICTKTLSFFFIDPPFWFCKFTSRDDIFSKCFNFVHLKTRQWNLFGNSGSDSFFGNHVIFFTVEFIGSWLIMHVVFLCKWTTPLFGPNLAPLGRISEYTTSAFENCLTGIPGDVSWRSSSLGGSWSPIGPMKSAYRLIDIAQYIAYIDGVTTYIYHGMIA